MNSGRKVTSLAVVSVQEESRVENAINETTYVPVSGYVHNGLKAVEVLFGTDGS